MSGRDSQFAQLHVLMTARLEGSETPAQAAALAQLLAGSREARRLYLTYVSDTVSLRLRAPDAVALPAARGWWPRWSGRMGWSAAVVLLMSLGVALWRGREQAATYRGVALLAREVNAEWEGPGRQPGASLPVGPLRLRRGIAQIEFFGGATLVIEGPADLELVSSARVYLRRGRVRASVPPPARGFTIDGPGLGVVDLGTEFGMAVGEGGSELRVFDGEVALRRAGGATEQLRTGAGVRVASDGSQAAPGPNIPFVDRAQLARLSQDDSARRFARWQEHSRALRADPDVVLYYSFEEQETWDRMLQNHAARAVTPARGAIVGCRWTAGRWPEKRALEWKRPGDRIRLEVPGSFPSLSFATWVRFDGLDRQWSSLFLTDDWDRGEPHWQVSRKGQVILGVSGPGNHFSPAVLSAHDLGRWTHLVTVYDAVSHRVTHYRDGVEVGGAPIRPHVPLVIGAAEIGNWGLPMGRKDHQIRNLNGAIDEFAIIARSLSSAEVRAMYQAGQPE